MKFFNKQTLAFAIVGALASGNALAAKAEIKTTATVYAQEIYVSPTTGKNFTVPLTWTTGYNFSGDEVRYACVKLEGGKYNAAPTVSVFDDDTLTNQVDQIGGTGAVNVGSVNLNDNIMFFSITSLQGAPEQIQDDYAIVLNSGAVNIKDKNAELWATVGLYDNPSNAAACGTAGLITPSYDRESLISFAPSFKFVSDSNKATASVNATPSFDLFKTESGVATTTVATLAGDIRLAALTPAPLTAAGVAIQLGDIFPASAKLTIAGDFNDWHTANAFSAPGAGAGVVAADKASSSWAAVTINATTGFTGNFTVTTTNNGKEIPAGYYAASLDVTPKAGYDLGAGDNKPVVLKPTVDETLVLNDNEVDDKVLGNAGQIVQDGVRLQAPLVQVPTGWLSRLVITNTGNKDRTFFLTVQGEDGTAITTGNLNGYVVKAKKTYVIEDMASVLQGFSAGAKTRATVIATVAGPEKEIKGLYQIVNTTNMSLSNYVMVNQDSGGH